MHQLLVQAEAMGLNVSSLNGSRSAPRMRLVRCVGLELLRPGWKWECFLQEPPNVLADIQVGECGLGLNMEVQWHWKEELKCFRPLWFSAVLAFAECTDLRHRRSIVGLAHVSDFLSEMIGMTVTSGSRPDVHSPEVNVFPFFKVTCL